MSRITMTSRQMVKPLLRSFTTQGPSLAPPPSKGAAKGATSTPSKSIYARKKPVEGDETAGPTGNVLSEVTQPPLDLSHLPPFDPERLTIKMIGEVMAFPESTLSTFKALSIPSLIQKEFAFTKRPSTVVRKSTLEMANLLDSSKSNSSQESRHILVGAAGSGKSILLLQAISYAQSTNWIVLYLPSSAPLINSSTPHAYSAPTQIFHQPTLSSSLLTRFTTANKSSLKSLKTTQEWKFNDKVVKMGESLMELSERGIKDERIAVVVLEALLDELRVQTTYPVLLAIDDAQALFNTSKYVDPSYRPIESYALSVPRLLLEFIAGTKSFAKGSILLSPSHLSRHVSPSFNAHLASLSPSSSSTSSQPKSVYTHQGTNLEIYSTILKGIPLLPLPDRLDRKEAMGIVTLLQGFRGVREVVNDQKFLETYFASDGNPREFVTRGWARNSTD